MKREIKKFRIRKMMGGFRIDEVVDGRSGYITWPSLFATESSAITYLAETVGNTNISLFLQTKTNPNGIGLVTERFNVWAS